jgi:hypothetical protein
MKCRRTQQEMPPEQEREGLSDLSAQWAVEKTNLNGAADE